MTNWNFWWGSIYASILAKLPDIKADKSLMSATIHCFCETWLNASQPSPVLNDDHIDIRCDRVTSENKGGVMMYVPNELTFNRAMVR